MKHKRWMIEGMQELLKREVDALLSNPRKFKKLAKEALKDVMREKMEDEITLATSKAGLRTFIVGEIRKALKEKIDKRIPYEISKQLKDVNKNSYEVYCAVHDYIKDTLRKENGQECIANRSRELKKRRNSEG